MKLPPNYITGFDQGSVEWFSTRLGQLSSSRIHDALAKRKRGEGDLQARLDLKVDLAVERIVNKPVPHFVSKYMERGTELEPMARAAYELRTQTRVRQVAYVCHPTIEMAGASPDGLCGDDGLVELKVPAWTTHAIYRLNGCVPEIYRDQMMWQMACSGRQWNDFCSYCDEFPEPLDLFICRMHRDDKRIAEMEAEARLFLAEVNEMVAKLQGGLEGSLRMSIAKARANFVEGITDQDIQQAVLTAQQAQER